MLFINYNDIVKNMEKYHTIPLSFHDHEIINIFEKEDDMETIYQKCRLSIQHENLSHNQTKIHDFFQTRCHHHMWTKREEVQYFGNDKRKRDQQFQNSERNKYFKNETI